MKRTYALLVLLPLTASLGAVYQSHWTPYVTLVGISSLTILGSLGRLRYLTYCILMMSLTVVLQTSLLGTYIIGIDIHGELYTTLQAVTHGWNTHWGANHNTSWVIGFLTPTLAKTSFSPVWQFKLLYPCIFSVVPSILFLLYRKLLPERMAFIATVFFLTTPMYNMETVGVVKSMISQTFLVSALYSIVRRRVFSTTICVIGAITSYYTIAIATLLYIWGIVGVVSLLQRKIEWRLVLTGNVGILTLVIWFSIIGNGATLTTFRTNIIGALNVLTDKHNYTSNTTTSGELDPYLSSKTGIYDGDLYRDYVLTRTQPERVTTTYLDNQEPLIRTALGIDFLRASMWGKIFRVLQFIVQLLILIGFYALWKLRRKIPKVYLALTIVALGLLGACLFIPFFSTFVSATRLYQLALIVLAPLFVLGVQRISRGYFTVITLAVFLPYYLFISGFVFEVTKSTDLHTIDTPYSFALSNYRTNIVGAFTRDDINVAEWIAQHENLRPMLTDYSGYTLLQGINDGRGIDALITPPTTSHYVFITTWSTEHQKLVFGRNGGLRYYQSLPSYIDVVYKQGGAVVYEVR